MPVLAVFAAGVALLAALVGWEMRAPALSPVTAEAKPDSALVARGAELARAGNCMACHTVQGGAPYAGGRGIDTPFGVIHTTNLTPDKATGIGNWSAAEFWRALHNGRSRDGRLLYPAFPYPDLTQTTREDSDALFAYLRTLPAVAQPARPHALRTPFDSTVALALWRALYFRPGVPESELESIFEAFVQSSRTKDGSGGTGLGLAICRKIVQAHGGRIHAENRAGGGAAFHVVLPARGEVETLPSPL